LGGVDGARAPHRAQHTRDPADSGTRPRLTSSLLSQASRVQAALELRLLLPAEIIPQLSDQEGWLTPHPPRAHLGHLTARRTGRWQRDRRHPDPRASGAHRSGAQPAACLRAMQLPGRRRYQHSARLRRRYAEALGSRLAGPEVGAD
jgi:hypothetical protein